MDINNEKCLPLLLAMVSNPKYKLNYLPKKTAQKVLKKIQNILIKTAEDILNDIKSIDEADDNNNENAGLIDGDDEGRWNLCRFAIEFIT